MNPPDEKDPTSFHQVLEIARIGAAIGIGAMFGFIGSIDSVNPRVELSFNWKVVVGVLGGGWFVWWVLGKIFGTAEDKDAQRDTKAARRNPVAWMIFFALLVGGLTLGGFAWSLNGTESEKLGDVIFGTVMAFWILGFGGLLIWNLIRFIEEDSRRGEEAFRKEEEARRQSSE